MKTQVKGGLTLLILIIGLLISVGYNVYLSANSQQREEKDVALFIQQLDRIMQIETMVREKSFRIRHLEKSKREALQRAADAENERLICREFINLLELEIYYLKRQIQDAEIIPINVTDDEHIDMFLKWSQPPIDDNE